jgi:signal transduction histidine kinase
MMKVLSVIKRNPIAFPIACIVAVAMLFVTENLYLESVRALDEMGTMRKTRVNIRDLAQGLADAETGQRGYLLTGDQEYLESYREGVAKVHQSLRELDLEYRDEPDNRRRVEAVVALTDTQLLELERAIRLHADGDPEAALNIVRGGVGKQIMGTKRDLIAELLDRELSDWVSVRQELYRTLLLSRIGLAALSAISLLALFLFLRHANEIKMHEGALKRSVQAERDGLEVNVAERTAQLTELTRHLLTAREDERNRLARNLHDELGALLTSAKLDAARIKSRLGGTAPEALERLAHLVDTLNSSIALGRRIIEDLRPSTLSNLGLVATLEILAREFAESSGVQVHCTLHATDLEPSVDIVIYRLVQEAFTNIGKYAKAGHVWLSLGERGAQVEVSIRDDGVGFDTGAQPHSTYGLVGMRFRVEAEGGQLAVVSAPGQGTQIRVVLPRERRAAAQARPGR